MHLPFISLVQDFKIPPLSINLFMDYIVDLLPRYVPGKSSQIHPLSTAQCSKKADKWNCLPPGLRTTSSIQAFKLRAVSAGCTVFPLLSETRSFFCSRLFKSPPSQIPG